MGNRFRLKGFHRYKIPPVLKRETDPLRALSLDFAAQSYTIGGRPIEDVQQLLTVQRATPKWVWNATGQLVEVPVDEPAYDHDPVTGEPLGLLVESEATNNLA